MAGMRRVPDRVLAKLRAIQAPAVVAGCGRCVPLTEIESGDYAHLGVHMESGTIVIPASPVMPPESCGPISRENIHGREVVHKDQPKEPKQVYLGDRPIYGDWSKGTFPLWQTRQVYPRSFIPPRGYLIGISEQGLVEAANCVKLTFTVEPALGRDESGFEDHLLFALNLLREVAGCFDVFESDVLPEDIVDTRQLTWDIFPPGERDLLGELERRLGNADDATRTRLLERAEVIESLNPEQYVLGTGFNSNYYGALFADDLVVFENLEYGNATYVLYQDWEQLSQLSRTELLASDADHDRLIHRAGWREHLTSLIRRERMKRRRQRW